MSAPSYIYGDTPNAVLNLARARINDLLITPAGSPSGSGDLQTTQVGGGTLLMELDSLGAVFLPTQVFFMAAWRRMQRYLASLGYRLQIATEIISSFPANASSDPAIESWLSWNGSYNGSSLAGSPALPSDFIAPLKIRERVHGSTPFLPMVNALDGLLNLPSKTTLNRQWLWQNQAIYFTGATGATDLQIRYIRLLPDIVATGGTAWYLQPIPIPNCISALAWYVVYEVVVARAGEQIAAGILSSAQFEADGIYNDQARADQRTKQVNESFPRPNANGAATEAQ